MAITFCEKAFECFTDVIASFYSSNSYLRVRKESIPLKQNKVR